jgi:small-conductance mechanosensitive channel
MIFWLLTAGIALAADSAATTTATPVPTSVPSAIVTRAPGTPLVIDGRTLALLGGTPTMGGPERALILKNRLDELLAAPTNPNWSIRDDQAGIQVLADDKVFVTITAADVALNGTTSARELADRWVRDLPPALATIRHEHSLEFVLTGLGLATVATLGALLLSRVATGLYRRAREGLSGGAHPSIEWVSSRLARAAYFRDLDVRPALLSLNLWAVWLVRLIILNGWFLVVLGLFPQTRRFNDALLRSILGAIQKLAFSIVAFMPNLVTIIITIIATRYAIRLNDFLFRRMLASPEELGLGLPPELIEVLGKLVGGLIWVMAAMVVAPLLPGLGTQTGQALGLIVGAMITFGSGSAVGNAVAGFVLTYMQPYRVGDRVSIGGVEGDVLEKQFTNTRLRTIKNEVISLTSNHILSSTIINYTTAASKQAGLILHTTVTIGYDVPRHQTEALLLEAARRTDGISEEPTPFVFVTNLGDFSIAYELNASTRFPHFKAVMYSELHKNIIDVFDEAGVEILSPTYQAVRDGNHTTVGGDHVPEGYVAPTFRVASVPGPAEPETSVTPLPHQPGLHRPTNEGDIPVAQRAQALYGAHPHYTDANT